MIALLARLTGLDALFVKIGLAVLLLGLLGVAKCSYDQSIIDRHDDKITRKTQTTDFEAKLEAADQRARDQAIITADERNRSDEIRKAPDSKPSAARVRLNCERLRRAGQDTSRIAACAGLSD